ncbi:unnamed protein product [Boreogadus saida]
MKEDSLTQCVEASASVCVVNKAASRVARGMTTGGAHPTVAGVNEKRKEVPAENRITRRPLVTEPPLQLGGTLDLTEAPSRMIHREGEELADGTLGHEVEVGCIHGQTETYPTNRITVQTQKGTFMVQAEVDHAGCVAGPSTWQPNHDDESPRKIYKRDGTATTCLVHGLHSPGDPRHDDRLRTDTPTGGEREPRPHRFLRLPPRRRGTYRQGWTV